MAKYELSLTVENANLEVTPEGPVTLSVLELIGPRGETGPQGPTGPAGSTQLDGLTDVDTSNASTGNLLRSDGDGTFSFVSVSGVSDDLDDVTTRGGTTTNDISVGALTATSLNTHTIPTGTGTLAKTSDIPTNNNQLTNGAGYITDYTVTQGDVTAHQAALSITESQISDLQSYITDYTVTEADVTAHQAALSITESQISDFGTYATLVGGTVPASQLPSYVDDVEEYTNYASFPASGETGKIYVDLATGDIYRWAGSAYVQINDAVSSADQATRLATARTISLGGDVSGSASFDGSANVTITAAVADDSHNHIISNVDGLQAALDGKLATTATTDDVSEGSTNFYYTSGRFDTAFAAKDTDDLSEGSTNLYYTDAKANAAIDARVDEAFVSALNVEAASAGTLTFTVKNSTGSTLEKGSVVYVSGLNGNTPEVSLARANSSSTMPAFGLVEEDIADTADGTVVTFGSLRSLDVSDFGETGITFSLGDTVYVSSSEAGKLTNVAPTGEANLIQNIGKIERASPTTNMTIKVGGAGRTNATPNLNQGKIFIGNSSNQAVAGSFGTGIDVTNEVVSIGQAVGTTDNVNFGNATLSGYLAGPATFTIDPAAVGDNTGKVVIAGDLQVDGTTTTVNSTTVEVSDKNVVLGADATADSQNHGAGITVSRPDSTDAGISWDETNDEWGITNGVNVSGAITADGLNLGDNDYIQLGDATNGDLQIYHDGSHSYIRDVGTGDLLVDGASVYIRSVAGNKYFSGAANITTLYHTNNPKLATTSTGVDVTGTVTAESLDVDTLNPMITFKGDDGIWYRVRVDESANRLLLGHSTNVALELSSSGETVVNGDLTVDTDTLHVDATNDRVGIGTTSPATELDVTGTVTADTFSFANWTVTESGGSLYFATGGTNKMKLDASGNLQVVGNVESNATIS